MSINLLKGGALQVGSSIIEDADILFYLNEPVRFIGDYRMRDLVNMTIRYPTLIRIMKMNQEPLLNVLKSMPPIGAVDFKIESFVLVKDVWIFPESPRNIDEQINTDKPADNCTRTNIKITPVDSNGKIAPIIKTKLEKWADTPLIRRSGTAYYGDGDSGSLDSFITLFELTTSFGCLLRMQLSTDVQE